MSKPEFAVTVLDRLHTLVVIAAGAAVGIVMLTLFPNRPDAQDKGLAAVLIALALAYAAAFAADVLISVTVRPFRDRLRAAARQADQVAVTPARTED